MIKKEDITFDPSRDELLGVFNDEVHIKYEDYASDKHCDYGVLIIPQEEYLRVWKNYLNGKQKYCENYGHYCGVMGYTSPIDIEKLNRKINLNIWNERLDEMEEVPAQVFYISKFEDTHDFEHG